MIERYNADLGKNLGNLLQRTLGLCARFPGGQRPVLGPATELEIAFWADVRSVLDTQVTPQWERLDMTAGLTGTMSISSRANQYVDHAAPWAAAKKGDTERLGTILATLLDALDWLSVLLWPVLPAKSGELRTQLGLPSLEPSIGRDVWPPERAGAAVGPLSAGNPLFPTYDAAATRAILDKLVPRISNVVAEEPTTAASLAALAVTPSAARVVDYEQFSAVDLRVGVVLTCERVPKKDKLLRLGVDLGEDAPRAIVAGLAKSFTPEVLVGRRVVVVANLAPRDFGKGLVSHGMLLATGPEDALELATVVGDSKPGSRLK
jgi:methionyl-tRNA synthetase